MDFSIARDDGGSVEKWSNSECMLKVEPTGLADGLLYEEVKKRGVRDETKAFGLRSQKNLSDRGRHQRNTCQPFLLSLQNSFHSYPYIAASIFLNSSWLVH